jgi:hypothetical protein
MTAFVNYSTVTGRSVEQKEIQIEDRGRKVQRRMHS